MDIGAIPIGAGFKDTLGNTITSIQQGHAFALEVILDQTTTSALDVTVTISDTAPVTMFAQSAIVGGYQATLTVPANSDRGLLSCSASAVSTSTGATFAAEANATSVNGTITVTP